MPAQRDSFFLNSLSDLGRRTEAPPIAWLMHRTLGRPDLISLAAGFTDSATLPAEETLAAAEAILRSPKRARAALQYGTSAGEDRLRERVAERTRQADGRSTVVSDQVVITHGSQQLLYLLLEVLADPGDIILVEDPTYFVFLGMAASRGVVCRGVRRDAEGVDPAALDARLESLWQSGELSRVKALYLVTYYQNPTGWGTSLERKQEALRVLSRWESRAGHRIHLIEDAAYRELGFEPGGTPSCLGLPEDEDRVLYTGTYSKPFATGLRVGFGILPRSLREKVLHVKGNQDFGTAHLLQHLLAEALDSGLYDRHLVQLRKRYALKAEVMVSAMREHFPKSVQYEFPKGGLYVWARLPGRFRTGMKSRFFNQALAADVLYVPGGLAYCADPERRACEREMRLSFGAESTTRIREGIRRLGSVLYQLGVSP